MLKRKLKEIPREAYFIAKKYESTTKVWEIELKVGLFGSKKKIILFFEIHA